jgi:hypothetical protein
MPRRAAEILQRLCFLRLNSSRGAFIPGAVRCAGRNRIFLLALCLYEYAVQSSLNLRCAARILRWSVLRLPVTRCASHPSTAPGRMILGCVFCLGQSSRCIHPGALAPRQDARKLEGSVFVWGQSRGAFIHGCTFRPRRVLRILRVFLRFQ